MIHVTKPTKPLKIGDEVRFGDIHYIVQDKYLEDKSRGWSIFARVGITDRVKFCKKYYKVEMPARCWPQPVTTGKEALGDLTKAVCGLYDAFEEYENKKKKKADRILKQINRDKDLMKFIISEFIG